MICENCGSKMILRKRLSGEKESLRYWVCEDYPKCKNQKGYAEQGKAGVWQLIGKMFVYGKRR